jgi:hypothetical protein
MAATSQIEIDPDDTSLSDLAESRGYVPGAHQEADKVRNAAKYVNKTKRDQDYAVNRYAR